MYMKYYFDQFSVLFTENEVHIGKQHLPLGQCTTDILNMDPELLTRIHEKAQTFAPAVDRLFKEKTHAAAVVAQEKLNDLWDLMLTLPVYRDLNMDLPLSYNFLPIMLEKKEKWSQMQDEKSGPRAMLNSLVEGITTLAQEIQGFQTQIGGILYFYIEPLKRRGAAAYAKAYAQYFHEMKSLEGFSDELSFEQSFPMESNFVPMRDPTKDGQLVLAEEATFSRLVHFLFVDFYRGLISGNAPRCCRNCGKFFLLTAGYNTCYCNNLAPGETERTCRKVGAHKKEAKERITATPAQKEYAKVYNRLKARKQRGKISVDEWNASVAAALDLKDKADRGELSDDEYRKQMSAF